MIRRSLLLLLPVLLFSGCHGPSHHGVRERIDHEQSPDQVEIAGVEYWLDGLRYEAYGEGDFFVRTRSDQLVQFPCARCHDQPGFAASRTDGDLPESAHLQILQPHGVAEGLACAHCHDGEDPSQLVGQKGPVDFDRVYDLCGTCHFEQRRDWEAGAHGKRLATWSGPRVIENCTGCHDPHAPRFETRLPTTMYPGSEGARR